MASECGNKEQYSNPEAVKCRRVGILGGTFDPIHFGHIYLAEAAREAFCLDLVLFMPTDDPYYKESNRVSSFQDRLTMTELALAAHDRLAASDFEKVHDTDGYTINSLTIYRKLYPLDDLYFIVGGDSLFSMEKWKDIEQIFRMTKILVNKRKGESKGASGSLALSGKECAEEPFDLDVELEQQIRYLRKTYHAEIYNLHAPQFDVSSSELRTMIREGADVTAFLPEAVIRYIADHHLYE